MIKKLLVTLILPALFLCASCSQNSNTLVVGLMPDFDSVPILLAKNLGYFENVELQLYNSPLDRDSALFSNTLDGTVSDLLQVCLATENGFPVRITSQTCSLYGVVAGKDSGIASLTEMEGRTVGLSFSTVIEYVLDMSLEQAGVDPAAVEKTSVPKIPTRLELVSRGQIDAISVPEPYITAAAEEGGKVLATSADAGLKPGVIMFTQRAVDEKSGQIKKFYEALDKAAEYIATHDRSEYFPAIMEEMGLPEPAALVPMPEYGGEGLPSEEELTAVADWLLEREMISKTFSYGRMIYDHESDN